MVGNKFTWYYIESKMSEIVEVWLSWAPLEACPYLQGYLGARSQAAHLASAFHLLAWL